VTYTPKLPMDRLRGEFTLTIKKEKSLRDDKHDGWEVWLLPSNEQLKARGYQADNFNIGPELLMTFEPWIKRFTIHPFYTAPELDGSYTRKYSWLVGISFDWEDPVDLPDEGTVHQVLEAQPEQFILTPDYGLGIKQGYRSVMRSVRELTDAAFLYIGREQALGDEFKIDRDQFRQICAEVKRIDQRAKKAENEVKDTTVFNALAEQAGKQQRPFRLGRNEIRQLIQNYAADPDFRDPEAQKALVTELGRSARTFAQQAPEATEQLISELELTRLELAIQEFEELMSKNHNENKWQKFFEDDPFLLSFAFGYPVVCVNGQSYVGGRRIDGKGEKIGDFLCKNSVNNNAALIEIKKPQSPVVKKYRDSVYGPHDELSGGVTQVLDQRYHFTRKFPLHQSDNDWHGENEVADYEIDCVLIVGTMPTDKDQRRSFQLYRKNSHGVRIVTFDEVLEMLKNLLEYLQTAKPN